MKRETANEMFERLRLQTLASTFFLFEKDLPEGITVDKIKDLLHKALKYNSIARLKCSIATYHALINFDRDFVLIELDLIISILQHATPIEMEQTLEENLLMQKDIVEPLHTQLSVLTNQLCEPIKRKVETHFRISQGVPDSKKLIVPNSGQA